LRKTVNNLLHKTAHLCALLAGILLALMALLTCASVIGRNVFDWALVGDFELVGVEMGLAVALFMPLCQLRQGHIVVDFFTSRASARTNAGLDRMGCFFMALVMALLAWRTGVGGLNAYDNHSGSMILGFPDWMVFAGMVLPLAFTAVIALWQALNGVQGAEGVAL
jgi:TRAP-type C4-dicarboxylate transport system permease small subunit